MQEGEIWCSLRKRKVPRFSVLSEITNWSPNTENLSILSEMADAQQRLQSAVDDMMQRINQAKLRPLQKQVMLQTALVSWTLLSHFFTDSIPV